MRTYGQTDRTVRINHVLYVHRWLRIHGISLNGIAKIKTRNVGIVRLSVCSYQPAIAGLLNPAEQDIVE